MIFTLTLTQLILQIQAKFDTSNKRIYYVTDEYGLFNYRMKDEFSQSLVSIDESDLQSTKKFILKKLQNNKFKDNILIEITDIISNFLLSRLKSILIKETALINYIEQRFEQPTINLIKEYAQKHYNYCSVENEMPTKEQTENIIKGLQESDEMINNFFLESSLFISTILETNDQIFSLITKRLHDESFLNFLTRYLPDKPKKKDILYLYENNCIFFSRVNFQNKHSFEDIIKQIASMNDIKGLMHYIIISHNCEYYIIKCFEEVFRYKRLSNIELCKRVSMDIRNLHEIKKILNEIKTLLKISNNSYKISVNIKYNLSIIQDECNNFFKKNNIIKNNFDLSIFDNYVYAYKIIGEYLALDEKPTQKYESELNKKIDFLADEVYKEDKTKGLNKTSTSIDRRIACQNQVFDKYILKKFTCYFIEENESELENS